MLFTLLSLQVSAFRVPRWSRLCRPVVMAAAVLALSCVHGAFALTTNDLAPARHSINVVAHRGYLSGIPVLVRVEVRNGTSPERALWNADATLSVNDAGVTLSTNQLLLRNGVGTTLVAVTGSADFDLTVTVGSLQATRSLSSLAGEPVTTVGGSLAGSNVWSGVIRVTNDVTIPAGASLTILSNTLVLIDGVTSGSAANDLLISGQIQSLGTEDHPIAITCNSANLSTRWGQIRHNSAQASLYRYTSISRAGRATGEGHTGTAPVIRPSGSTIRFDNCNITDLSEQRRGVTGFGGPGKIGYGVNSDLTFVNCIFQRARMGPEISGTALACTNTWMMDMRGNDDADGIYLHDQAAGQLLTLSGCVLANGDDDGIDTLGASLTVEDCILRDWASVVEDAKALSVFNGATTVRRTLIVDSTVGIAAKWSGGAPTIVNMDRCTLTRNLTNVWANWKANAAGPFIDYRITNSVLWGGDSVQSDFGDTNFTIRYCNVSEPWAGAGNINSDPLFVNADEHDFRLQPYSPSIDSGDPSSAVDADGSRADMGAFPFTAPAPWVGITKIAGAVEFTLTAYTNRSYVIESATDLNSSWSILSTNLQTAPTMRIEAIPSDPQRFYRVRLP